MTDPEYPSSPPTAPPPGAPMPTSPWAPPPESLAPPPSPRTPVRLVAIGLGVAALAGGAAFAVTSLLGDERGAATPEQAGEALIAAIGDDDLLGVVDLLPAGEREVLRDLLTGARDEYRRLDLLSERFRLDGIPGLDITVTDVELDVEEITDGDGPNDGLAQVFVTAGDVTIEVDGDTLVGNLGRVVEAVAEERDIELVVDDTDEELDAEELGASFTVVEEDGRWHPSLLFTAAELARQSSFDPRDEPDFGRGVEPAGERSPEEAVQALFDAASDLDPEAAIAVLDPGEARALQVYSQFFLPIDDVDDVELSIELTDAEVDRLGGSASRVVPTGLEVRFEADGGRGDIVLDDGCVTVDIQPPPGEGEPLAEEFCMGDDPSDLLPAEIADIEISDELREVAEAFQPLRFGIITVERGGEHFVAPIRTFGDLLLGVTRGLEPADLDEGGAVFALLAGDLDDEIEDLFDQFAESTFVADAPEDQCIGIGCGFGEDEGLVVPDPTGASGPNGELLVFDAVVGEVGPDETATFTAVPDEGGLFVIGVQGENGFDPTVRVVDASTGAELAFNDDFFGTDSEVRVQLAAGQAVTIEVRGFGGAAGAFLVYFLPF